MIYPKLTTSLGIVVPATFIKACIKEKKWKQCFQEEKK
jgi:hypothetical protein